VRAPPKFLFLTVNEVCNLRCMHCRYWQSKRGPQIPVSRQLELVEEFAELAPGGRVVICGGEPMLDPTAYFGVCAAARKCGLQTLSVVNGTMISEPWQATRMVTCGPDKVSISLDHPVESVHNNVRGIVGSYGKALDAMTYLLAARGSDKTPRIYAMGLLGKSTVPYLDQFYELVLKTIGADKLKLNAVQPTFLCTRGEAGQEPESDLFFARESQVNAILLRRTLENCAFKYDLHLDPEWVNIMTSYFRSLWQKPEEDLLKGWLCGIDTFRHICNSYERNVMVDLDGVASLCFSRTFRSEKLQVRGDMRKFWEGADDVREEMRTCNRICGISHSVRRVSATLRGALP
jgi:MoaA/NifB/PqqE/SkfB family radical SAM enzyme